MICFIYLNYYIVIKAQFSRIKQFFFIYNFSQEWLKAYSSMSKSTWRVERTYKSTGKFVIFKKDYRCCHFTDRRAKGEGPSKHTGCQAKLEITVQR